MHTNNPTNNSTNNPNNNPKNINNNTYLVISSHNPLDPNLASNTIDLALTFSSMSGKLSLLFLGAGVLQLAKKFHEHANNTAYLHILQELEIYDLHNVLVLQESLTEHKLQLEDLICTPKVITAMQLSTLIIQHQVVLHL